MADNSINKKRDKDVPLGMIETARSKVQRIKCSGEPKEPTSGSKVKLTKPTTTLTQEQIADRAFAIWQKRGCRPGEEEWNWNEAEIQLRAESSID